jgi:hypothetical protein
MSCRRRAARAVAVSSTGGLDGEGDGGGELGQVVRWLEIVWLVLVVELDTRETPGVLLFGHLIFQKVLSEHLGRRLCSYLFFFFTFPLT